MYLISSVLMVSLRAFSELLAVLYSAPLDASHWQHFLTLLCAHTNCKNACFFTTDSRPGLTMQAVGGAPYNTQVAIEYNEKYGGSDPFRTALVRQKALSGVFQADCLFPNDGLLQTTIYREFISHLGLRHAAVVLLTISVQRFEAISIWRTSEAGPMNEEGLALLALLIPHIQKALEIRQALGAAHRCLAGAKAIADATSTATLLVTRRGKVVHCNAAAELLVSRGNPISVFEHTLVASNHEANDELRNILKAASAASGRTDTPATRALALPRGGTQRPMQLLVTPLPKTLGDRSGADVLVLITDPDRPHSFADSVLKTLYGFTAAEEEVATGLLNGYSLQEIALLRKVTLGTTRIQIKSLLSKTNTTRQSDLVRLLVTLPQPFDY